MRRRSRRLRQGDVLRPVCNASREPASFFIAHSLQQHAAPRVESRRRSQPFLSAARDAVNQRPSSWFPDDVSGAVDGFTAWLLATPLPATRFSACLHTCRGVDVGHGGQGTAVQGPGGQGTGGQDWRPGTGGQATGRQALAVRPGCQGTGGQCTGCQGHWRQAWRSGPGRRARGQGPVPGQGGGHGGQGPGGQGPGSMDAGRHVVRDRWVKGLRQGTGVRAPRSRGRRQGTAVWAPAVQGPVARHGRQGTGGQGWRQGWPVCTNTTHCDSAACENARRKLLPARGCDLITDPPTGSLPRSLRLLCGANHPGRSPGPCTTVRSDQVLVRHQPTSLTDPVPPMGPAAIRSWRQQSRRIRTSKLRSSIRFPLARR